MAGLLVVEGRLVGVELTLFQAGGMETVRGRDRVVVAQGTMAQKDFVHQFLTFDRQFQRHAQVVVVEWRLIDTHWHCVVQRAGFLQQTRVGRAAHQCGCFRINAVDGVHRTVHQRVLACCDVNDGQDFNLIEMRAAFFEVVRVALAQCTNARFEAFDHVGASADACDRIDHAVFGWQDDEVVVRQQEREVGIAFAEREDNGHAIGLNVGHRGHVAFGGRFGIFATVIIDRCNDVFGGHGLAVVEFHAFTQADAPDFRIRCRFPARGQIAHQGAVAVNFGQVVAVGVTCVLHKAVFISRRIKAVGCRTVAQTHFERTTLLGCHGHSLVGPTHRGWYNDTGGQHRRHELTA